MTKLALVLSAISTLLFLATAAYGQYGAPGPSLSILIEKMVSTPGTSGGQATNATFVDNLSPSDPRFAPGQTLFFKLVVQNTSNVTITNVTVTDNVPTDIQPISGPGSFDSNSRVLTFGAGDFNPGDQKTYYLQMQVLPQNQLPADQGLFCQTNTATASNGTVSDNSSSQFCIEKQVLGVATTPSAGPEFGAVLLSLDLIGVGAGWLLKKKIS